MDGLLIENYIPAGYEHRVSRQHLEQVTGIPDRKIRKEIEGALARGILIVSRDGGYFRYGGRRDDRYVEDYMRSENKRFRTQSHNNRLRRECWERLHPSGQLSLFGEGA